MKQEIEKYVGKEAIIYAYNTLKVRVKILDVKSSYGRTRYLVTPISGSGEVWVENLYVEKE